MGQKRGTVWGRKDECRAEKWGCAYACPKCDLRNKALALLALHFTCPTGNNEEIVAAAWATECARRTAGL
ncbi:hypothetical protein GCM10008942_14070 [Rhizomicrobium electricum]|uniref:Uncharacterized protein n=1 Tax=Rhizomicrobium electricum TaxID=480070 RepID=A0ABP3PG60_9PROT